MPSGGVHPITQLSHSKPSARRSQSGQAGEFERNPFVAGLAGGCDLLAQLIEFRGVIPGFGDRQQQPTDIGRFFNGVNMAWASAT
jgi:hypothetical protein